MRASRVGVHTFVPIERGRVFKPCARCGFERQCRTDGTSPDLCNQCRSVEPQWGTVPFEQLPVSDSNVCAFDEPFESNTNRRRRERRAAQREEQG